MKYNTNELIDVMFQYYMEIGRDHLEIIKVYDELMDLLETYNLDRHAILSIESKVNELRGNDIEYTFKDAIELYKALTK